MARDDDAVQWLDDGSGEVLDDAPPRPRRRWSRWWPVLLAAVVAAIVIVAVTNHGKPTASTTPAAPPPPSPASPTTPTASFPAVPSTVRVTEVGHPLLGVTAGWELFARNADAVIRIQPALGRITRTTVPALASSGPVSFAVMSGQAIVRPLDVVPGYAVPDGRPARQLPGILNEEGPAVPGPDPRHVWVLSGSNAHPKMVLVDGHGRPGVAIPVPADMNGFPEPDGGGYVLLTGTGGAYSARPDGLRRITTGQVLAAGPTGWLTRECDDRHRCRSVVIDRATGARHLLKNLAGFDDASGVISPNGATAAVVTTNGNVHMIDLASGRDHVLPVSVDRSETAEGTVVWSPDSRWLLVADSGQLVVIPRTGEGHVRGLGVTLPQVVQLAVRGTNR